MTLSIEETMTFWHKSTDAISFIQSLLKCEVLQVPLHMGLCLIVHGFGDRTTTGPSAKYSITALDSHKPNRLYGNNGLIFY